MKFNAVTVNLFFKVFKSIIIKDHIIIKLSKSQIPKSYRNRLAYKQLKMGYYDN